jgi:hypothetical protein
MNPVVVYHVAPTSVGWALRSGEALDPGSAYADKVTAVRQAQELARRSHGQLVIHREDGSIQAEHSY